MAIAYVQQVGTNSRVDGVTGTTLTVTVPAGGVALGHTLVAAFATSANTDVSPTMSDARGNTYALRRSDDHSATSLWLYVFEAPITTALSSGDLITVTFTSTTTHRAVAINEYSGLAAAALDQVTSAEGSSQTPSSGSVTTTQADELIVGLGVMFDKAWTAGTNFTERTELLFGTRDLYVEDRIVSSTGSYAADASTADTATSWVMAVLTLKGDVSGATYTETPAFVGELCDAGMSEVYTAPSSGPPVGSLMLLGVGR